MKTINSFRSKLFALTLTLMASVSTFAYDYHGDLLCYNILTDSTVAVTGQSEYKTMPRYEYLPENLVIPAEVTLQGKTYKVVSIDQWAFYACSMLKSVIIPHTVTFIGMSAFHYCENLADVYIPYSVTTVEGSAFAYTKWYDNLPDGEVYINNTLYRYKGTAPENTKIVVKDGTTRIAGFTFWNQSNIISIELPQTLTVIEHDAFEGCTQLSSILIPKNVTFIGCSAFAKCTGLMEVICLAPTPPIAGVSANPSPSDWMFAGVEVSKIPLYVPAESIDLYKEAEQWMFFNPILPIEPTSYKSQWCNKWNVMWFDGLFFDETASTSQYRLGKDTVIGDYVYSKFTSRTSVRFTSDRKVYVYYEGFDDNDPYTEDLPTGEYLAYDFSAQVGDTLEVFSGIGTYSTYPCVVDDVETAPSPCVVDDVQADLKTFPLIIKLHPLCDVDGEGNMEISSEEITWIEGVGSPEGFLISSLPCGWVGGGTYALLCAYKGDELKYTGPLYEEYGCEYNAGPFNEKLLGTWRVVGGNEIISISDSIIVFIGLTQKYTASATQLTVERLWIPEEESYRWANCNYTLSNDTLWIDNFMPLLVATYPPTFGPITLVKVKHEDLFPTLLGLQRTVCNEYCGDTEDDNSANNTYKQTFDSIFFENDKPYILCNGYLLREEENKILIYSQILNKDLVLYDFTLEVGDSLPALYIDYHARNAMDWMPYNPDVVDYNKDFDGTIYPADTFVVTDVSNVTLLDGKAYKKWTFDNGMEYVEGIGMYGGHRNGDFFRLIQEIIIPCNPGTHLVCVSKNGKLLYQMDDAEMERLGAECLCDYDRGPRKDNAKDGQIGGRPTPTQWNQLEVVLRQMDNNHTILQAETFSYTLEDISQQVNNKTYFQLARQSTKDTATTKSVVGALHFGKDEDNRVYFLRDGVEYVLYDFTAEPGDTIEIFAGINNYPQETTYTHVVVDKDTTEDGACRMFLEVVFPDETTAENAEKVWLAGLGSVDGIVHNAAKRTSNAHAAPSRSASSETESSVMLCAWREDSCLYTTNHPDYETFGCVYNQEPTSVEDISTSQSSYQKIIREGQFLILHNGKTYSVMGIEL